MAILRPIPPLNHNADRSVGSTRLWNRPGEAHFSKLVEPVPAGYDLLVMQMFHAESVMEKDGKLHLDHVPFSEGEAVHVFVSPAIRVTHHLLKGSVLKYEQPLASVAEEDWEAAK